MGKVTSLQGKATGKVGSMVYSVNGGQMIAREYQPNVTNPSTQAQVNQRAKLKLISQVAAALAPVIAIPKNGLQSSRNIFVKKNFNLAYANDGIAQLTYENLQLTTGNAGLPTLYINRSQVDGLTLNLLEDASKSVSRVVYILYRKTAEQKLQFVQSKIVSEPGDGGYFRTTMPYLSGDLVAFAYGMKDLNARATAKFSNYSVANGEDIAKLTLNRNINGSDFQFTQTRGTTLFAGDVDSTSADDNMVRVYVTAVGNGTVSGAGMYPLGSEVAVTATPGSNAKFSGWSYNGSNAIIATAATYKFTLTQQVDLVATFESIPSGNDEP